MVSLEQVKLLESKVTNTIEYVKKVTAENTKLKGKLDSYQERIEELEVLVQEFKENQGKIEDGILSALDRLNQFEDALESKLSTESKLSAESKVPNEDKPPVESKLPAVENKPSVENRVSPIDSKLPVESKPVKETQVPQTAKAADEEISVDLVGDKVDGELDIF